MFSAESMAPAPIPSGTANRHSHSMPPEQENPSSAAAVIEVLTAVILAVPKRLMSLADIRLVQMVQPEMMRVTKFAQDTGRWNSA